MSLQFILGNSGSGKTEYAFRQIVKEAGEHPKKNYLILVPEQFTMQTQKKLVSLAPNHAIMNIDVLSFKRLAYRVFDDMGIGDVRVLEETGKNLVLRKVAQEKEEQLTVLRANMERMGYIEEVKSMISEMMQYRITPEQLEQFVDRERVSDNQAFCAKISDIITMYRGFMDFMEGNYITAEEILNLLIELVEQSQLLRDSVVVLDEFTGFTPIQNHLIRKLLPVTESIRVLLTIDAGENFYRCEGNHELFYLTKHTMEQLSRMAQELLVPIDKPVVLDGSGKKRFAHTADLAFMEQNLFRTWYRRKHGEVSDIVITSGKNPKEELLYTAREIVRLVRSKNYRYKDIAVVTGDVDSYGKYVGEIFEQYQIPYFLDQTTEVLFHPFIECIRAALEIVSSNFSYEAVMRFLRCGFADIKEADIDLLDNYLLAIGIRGRSAWKKRWVRLPRQSAGYDLELLEELRIQIWDILSPLLTAFEGNATVSDGILGLYEMLRKMDCENKLWAKEAEYLSRGQQAKAKEYGQIYRVVMELLEKYHALLGQEHMNVEEFIEVLDAGLAAAQVAAIPPGYDNVTIGDIERTRLDHIKVLFFIGVNDGIVPKGGSQGGIISEYERELLKEANLELAPGAREQAFIQRFYLYRNLTKPSERLYISYARVDSAGKAIRPSYLIGVLCRLFPDMKVLELEDLAKQPDFSTKEAALDYMIYGQKDETWYALAHALSAGAEEDEEKKQQVCRILEAPFYRYTDEPISRIAAQAIYGRTIEGSVTRLERFAACAYAHFLQYGLNLKERETNRFQNPDIGNLYHDALEKYSYKLKESQYDWFGVPDEVREQFSDEAMREAVESYYNPSVFETASTVHQLKRMGEIFKQTVWALTRQVRAGEFVPEAFEVSFQELTDVADLRMTFADDAGMSLRGRIDRMDCCADEGKLYVKVIDYKSGSTKFDLIRIYQGLELQLMVYMGAGMDWMKQQNPNYEVLPAAVLYYHIDDPVIDIDGDRNMTQEEVEQELLQSLRPDGLINRDEQVIAHLDKNLEGKSQVIPVELKKSGEIYESRSHVADTEEFAVIEEYVRNQIRYQGRQIYEGVVSVNPYKDGSQVSCAYCPYASVCGFDARIPGYQYRRLEHPDKAGIIEQMQIENAKSAHLEQGR